MDWYGLVPSLPGVSKSSVVGPFSSLKKAKACNEARVVFSCGCGYSPEDFGDSIEEMDSTARLTPNDGKGPWVARLVTPDRWWDAGDPKGEA